MDAFSCNEHSSLILLNKYISELKFGGRIEVGNKSYERVITAEGSIGINYVNPNDNYFYADIGPVTFQSFF